MEMNTKTIFKISAVSLQSVQDLRNCQHEYDQLAEGAETYGERGQWEGCLRHIFIIVLVIMVIIILIVIG